MYMYIPRISDLGQQVIVQETLDTHIQQMIFLYIALYLVYYCGNLSDLYSFPMISLFYSFCRISTSLRNVVRVSIAKCYIFGQYYSVYFSILGTILIFLLVHSFTVCFSLIMIIITVISTVMFISCG